MLDSLVYVAHGEAVTPLDIRMLKLKIKVES